MGTPFKWVVDVPAGILRNHMLSQAIRKAAVEECIILPFVKTEPGFGKGKGDTLNLTRIAQLTEPADASLVENTAIPADSFVIDSFAVTIGEFGRSVPFTSFAKDLAHFDLENSIQDVLMTQMRKVLDTSAAVA